MIQFSKDFLWGVATSAYQIEGAHDKYGKGSSIWDAFCTIPKRVKNGESGAIATDHYHKFKEDIALMRSQGFKAYRFSISWPRILPQGKGKVNKQGIQFYNELIDELLANNIEPWVTLYHWDLPLALQLEEDGWCNPDIAEYFADYAKICFDNFGDRVKNWITLNEPWVVAILGYGQGAFAPGRVSNTEPYLVGHNLLRAHARAVEVYRQSEAGKSGQIGISNNCDWREPLSGKPKDIEAAERALLFFLGWFADPIYKGEYPKVMRDRLGDRLPSFTEEERKSLLGSSDFFGLNHYTTMYAAHSDDTSVQGSVYGNGGLSEDQDVILSIDKNWETTLMNWAIAPWGCEKLLKWIDERYDRPQIYITENGGAFEDKMINGEINDHDRIEYYKGYLAACHQAIQNGVQLKGYFAWSFMDNFEWASGYSKTFGINHVDYHTLKRTPKASAKWFTKMIKDNDFKLI